MSKPAQQQEVSGGYTVSYKAFTYGYTVRRKVQMYENYGQINYFNIHILITVYCILSHSHLWQKRVCLGGMEPIDE